MATPELLAFLREPWADVVPKLTNHDGYTEESSGKPPCAIGLVGPQEVRRGIPVCVLNEGNDIFRGTGMPCLNSRFSYNFNQCVWFTWETVTARAYAGPNGCVVVYQAPPGGLQLLDFWDLDVILDILVRI
jgi:hypothetical protein